jgi:hypothetical protein
MSEEFRRKMKNTIRLNYPIVVVAGIAGIIAGYEGNIVAALAFIVALILLWIIEMDRQLIAVQSDSISLLEDYFWNKCQCRKEKP